MTLVETLRRTYERVWNEPRTGAHGRLLFAARLLLCTLREVQRGDLTMRAMSMVYTTLLALVPLLALSFSVFKALGLHNEIEPMLLNLLQPLGSEAPRVTEQLMGFVDNIKIGVLGSIGIALLFYTVLSMIQKVEAAFNTIWRIPASRPFGQRVSQYLVVLLLGPLALTLAFGITASLSSHSLVASLLSLPGIGEGVLLLGFLTPFLVICGIFAFLFKYVPNTYVQPSAAIVGGLVSGLMWQAAALGFANFVAGSSNYNAIYSSFAILIVLLIWLYVAWLVLLIGCQISYFMQHPEYLTRERDHRNLGPLETEALLLDAMVEIGHRFGAGEPALDAQALCHKLDARPEHLSPLLDALIEAEALAEDVEGRLRLARPAEALSLAWLAEQAHLRLSRPAGSHPRRASDARVQKVSGELEAARRGALGERTLADLLAREPA